MSIERWVSFLTRACRQVLLSLPVNNRLFWTTVFVKIRHQILWMDLVFFVLINVV